MSEFLRTTARGAAIATIGFTSLTGCTSTPEGGADASFSSNELSPLYKHIDLSDQVKLEDSADSIIGTPIEVTAEPLTSGAMLVTSKESVNSYDINENTSLALISFDCEGRVVDTGRTEILDDGFRIEGVKCLNDKGEISRPFVWKPGMHENVDYSEYQPSNASKFLVAVGLNSDPNAIGFDFQPSDKSTAIEVHGIEKYILGQQFVETDK